MSAQALERVEHRYRPVGSARDLFHCRDPEVLLSGAAGTGKSRACLEKLHSMALSNPGMRGVILRKTAVSLGSTALVTYREHVAKEALASGEVRYYGGSAQEAASYRYGNGSVIVIGRAPTRSFARSLHCRSRIVGSVSLRTSTAPTKFCSPSAPRVTRSTLP